MMVARAVSQELLHALEGAYLRACEVELHAPKPGNVSMQAAGHDMCAADFMKSAKASAGALVSPDASLGERIYKAVALTREKISCNTNLGIVLLCAPLLHAVLTREPPRGLREQLRRVLREADVKDSEGLYSAIRLAAPGGLGRSELHDVCETPRIAVVEAMQVAAQRDRIAFQYTNGFADIFDYAVPRLLEYRARWKSDAWAAVAVFLGLLRRFPDSHVARKHGDARAREVSAKAARLDAELSQCRAPEELTQRLQEVDVEFKSAGINPGTTADLTVASLMVYYLEKLLSTGKKDLSITTSARGDRRTERKESGIDRAAALFAFRISCPPVSCITMT